MSHHQGVLGGPLAGNHRPLPVPKSKRLRTKRERNATKFGPKVPSGGSRQGPSVPRHWLLPPPRGGLALGSPLGPPKPVVITQNRLCHRGLFNNEVKSLDVRRLPTPAPGGDGLPPAPQTEEGVVGGVPAEALKDLVASLASLLGSFGAFPGRELVSERRWSLMATLRRHRQGPPDLGVFLAHRTPAQPPGQGTPRTPRKEERPGPPGRAVNLGRWEVGKSPTRTPSPPRAVDTLPPHHRPSPIFGAPRERENLFSWSSAEDEEDETHGGLTQTWGDPRGLLQAAPRFWSSPQPPEEEEDEGDEGWTPIAPPAFSPDLPCWGPPQSRDTRGPPRAPRPPRALKIWRTETPWDPPDQSRSPRDAPRPPWGSLGPPHTTPRFLWEFPDPTKAPLTPPRPSRPPQIWSPEPRRALPDPTRPLWDPPSPSRPLRDPRPWGPELPRAVLDHPSSPRTPQLWIPEPPRALLDTPRPLWESPRPQWEPPDAPRPLWGSPDPPRFPWTPQLWSPEPPWDPPRPSRHPRLWSPGPPRAPPNMEPSRCCCRRLRHDTAERDPLRRRSLRRDPSHRAPLCRDPCCPPPPKRHRPDRAVAGGVARGGRGDSPRSPPLPSGCRCPCRGICGGGGAEMRRGL